LIPRALSLDKAGAAFGKAGRLWQGAGSVNLILPVGEADGEVAAEG